MKLQNRAESGCVIPIWVILMALIVTLALLAYLFAHLLRIPPRQLPPDPDTNLLPYIAERIPSFSNPDQPINHAAPEGWKWKQVPFLSSTNLVDWETIMATVDANGSFSTPDGASLLVNPVWDDDAGLYSEFQIILIHPGTNRNRFFKWP